MKPGINVISVFERRKDESGVEHFSGTLDLKALKRLKCDEISVVMMTGDLLPTSLHSLMGKNAATKDGLFMFVETEPIGKA